MLRISRFLLFGLFLAVLPVAADPGLQPDLPADVPADWWSQVQRSIQLEEYAVVAEGAAGTDFRAVNPAHRFEARFDADGMRLTPTEGTSWEWGLSLTGWGRPGALDAAEVRWLSADEDRVELDRGLLTEWFVNSPDGLEHGFTVPFPPCDAGNRLVLDMALTGGLRPVFAEDGQAVDFYGSGNVSVLRYAKLVVTDAAGVLLPAWMDPISGGIRIVVEDSRAIYPITVDPLATSPSWTAVGEAANDRFGYSVATAGDVNGDGYSDVVVGAHGNTSWTGKAYLYLGGASGLAASASWTAVGEATDNYFGFSVATAGDVNGDGYSDVILGAFGNSSGTGKAYLYLGGASGLALSDAWTAVGEAVDDRFGWSVATAGDVNGDGYSDVVVGAHAYTNSTGKAYLYLGGASGLAASASWTAVGEALGDDFAHSVAMAGDVNGDGYSDVVVGAYSHATATGKAYLYLGGASGLAASASWTAMGEAWMNFFGYSVATAGDVNGDGYSDVVVGAYSNNVSTGKAYLYLGMASGLAASASWTAVGETTGNRFGWSVATAGDVNGDGYSDVVVGADGNNGRTGKAYLYLGGASGLAASASWTVEGEAFEDNFGYSVATAGDVNGDGYSDVIIGAYGNTAFTGKAYLYLGGASGLALSDAWTATGEAVGDNFGYSVATAGDVNGDGYSDVVVGTRNNSGTGKAYLYLGGASGPSASASWTAVGEETGDRFGSSVATAGDVNGDGYSDVVVGANGNTSNTGKAYLYLGGPGGLSASASWTAVGEATGNYFGRSMATAGDVNGDGYSDVIVGARGNNSSTGKAYLYLGGASGLAASASWTAVGEAVVDYFGYSVATAGDVNGDGYSDVVVGAHGNTSGTGKAYLYLGGASGLAASAAWTGTGETVGDWFGYSVATAGDVNGDGYSDVIVGEPYNDGGLGKAYLYLGGASGLSASASWTAVGENALNFFGRSVAMAGDVNGDGYSDVIVGAEGNTSDTGKAYLYAGGASGLAASASWTSTGEAASDQFGVSVVAAGDVNGDGYSDVVVGAQGNNSYTGKVYLYFGGGGAGVSLMPRQLRADLSAPIHTGGLAYEQQFRLGLTLRSPVGRVPRTLQWQVAPWGGYFIPAMNPIQSDLDWYSTPVTLTTLLTLPHDSIRYVWRARVRYHPTQSPFLPWSPWFTLSGNGLREADLLSTSQEAPPVCVVPDEELYITTITIDGNGKPVLHYQDPNQPADVTGYNIYRAAAPTGPWVMLGSNVVDMDEGTPDIQYVDQTGDVGGPWYYEVAAWNDACGVEGPY